VDKYTVRKAGHEDRFEVLDLLKNLGLTVPPGAHKEEVNLHWDRLWKSNPSASNLNEEDGFIGHVLEYGAEIVGFFGSIPRLYCYQGENVLVSIGSQWGIKKPHRKAKNLLIDAYFNNPLYPIKLATTAIKQSGKIYANHDGHRIPINSLIKVYYVPLKTKTLIRHMIPQKMSFTAPFLSTFLDVGFRFRKREYPDVKNFSKVSDKQRLIDFFKEEQDRSTQFHAKLDADNIEWYLDSGSKKLQKRMFLVEKNTKVLGYSILCEEVVPNKPELKRMKVLDMRYEHREIAKELMLHARQFAKDAGMDVLEYHHNAYFDPLIIPYKTLKRKLPQFPFFYQTKNEKWMKVLSNAANWRLSPYDGDTSLG
jgi:hypothetical protein